eukprot:1453753-Prymnesium_polylepis.2
MPAAERHALNYKGGRNYVPRTHALGDFAIHSGFAAVSRRFRGSFGTSVHAATPRAAMNAYPYGVCRTQGAPAQTGARASSSQRAWLQRDVE